MVFIVAFQNSYAIIIVMKASYKEAGKTRKWLFSVLVAIALVFSFVAPMFVTTQGSVYADSSIDEVDESVQTDKDDDDVTCMNSGAGKSLGWILCPVLDLLTNTAEKTYNSIIKPSMNIESDLFDQSKAGAGTHSAWSVFQGIANVAFVVLFMVVIVSQVTGIGINNYGIKKILPKLIVVAILVNISWYICVIATDVSNIIGNSIQELFEHLPTGGGEAASITLATVSGGERAINIAAKGTLNAVAILGAVAGIGAIIINPAILLSLLISALGVVISVFTLFILLSARQALVVVLTVVSPVAIVCFMLPNTKKIFDRWLKISEGMLLVYPICGLLVGGGDYVSRLLLTLANQGGFFIVLTAMIVGIVPIFFIPTVLKKSFAAAGDIGAKISGYGQKVRGGAQSSVRNSEAYKRAQTRMNAGINRKGDMTAGGKLRTNLAKSRFGKAVGLDAKMNRSLADARGQFLKDKVLDQKAKGMAGDGFAAALIDQQKAAEKEEMLQYMTLINNDTRNGEDEGKLFAMFDQYMADGNKAGAVAVARIAGRRKDTAARFLGEKITGATLDPEKAGYNEKLAALNANTSDERRALFQGVAKEIATGENSGSYREASPLGFEFAAAHNRDANTTETDENGKPKWKENTDYSKWANEANVSRATGNYLTNSKELVGAKNSTLEEIAARMANGSISSDERTRLQRLAQMTIDNRNTTGVWDTTKEKAIYAIAAGGGDAPVGPPRHAPTGPDGELDVNGGNGPNPGSGGGPTPPTPPAPTPTPPAPSGGNAGGWYDTNNGGGNGADPGAGIID